MKMWQKGLIALVLGLIGGAGAWYVSSLGHDGVHYHAGFQVYDGDTLVDFSGPEFMYLGECGKMGHSFETVRDRVHLHERIGDVAHIHDEGVTWRDMFLSLDQESYLEEIDVVLLENELRGSEVLDQVIQPHERVIFVANQSDSERSVTSLWEDMISEEYIREVEEKSLNCNPL